MVALRAMAGDKGTANDFVRRTEAGQGQKAMAGGARGRRQAWASAVHTPMTDPDDLEPRLPARVERMVLRTGTGGAHQWDGGGGPSRKVRAPSHTTPAVLASCRIRGPQGLDGGAPAAPGESLVCRAAGAGERSAREARLTLSAGDTFVRETPTAWGAGRRLGASGSDWTLG